ncbi:hypothetical protein [Parasulfuritortus cantonensis]|uniref:hypothetical protein n=1 Tax=Parasulfuritortus cantonensis TaxID=2528202 RepID=UPI001405191D|nr:hypothetical protein [Parasulfuritortus cantonensis]
MSGRTLMIAATAMAMLGLPSLVQARESVTSIKPLLIEALQAGKAAGTLVGRDALALSGQFGTAAPILVDVERIGTHTEAGCGRLRVVTRQAGVVERDAQGKAGPATDQSFAWQVNYCRSGRFPIGESGEGVDE